MIADRPLRDHPRVRAAPTPEAWEWMTDCSGLTPTSGVPLFADIRAIRETTARREDYRRKLNRARK